ncbi:hypothetical protein K2173_001612 [Erythroxylum novogranatense]|uniref:Secreted protein n=1 Tax=Erythroxylum novogranatense TaxID=1862640 RepID=A0AAV8T547_9ROSI|nr:hypothetical protein K2173_001612 [Erythroxylum novogranatense]
MGGVAHFRRSQVFAVFFCFWGLFSIAWATRLSVSRQKLEVQKHLKRLNKPAVQSIQFLKTWVVELAGLLPVFGLHVNEGLEASFHRQRHLNQEWGGEFCI